MDQKNRIGVYCFILMVLFFSMLPIRLGHTYQQTIESLDFFNEAVIEISDFTDFEFTDDHADIDSSINETHVEFTFQGSYSGPITDETYSYFVSTNSTDFYIRLNLDYFMTSVSEGMISYMKVYGEDHSIAEAGVWDAWSGNQAKYYVKTWPDSIADQYESATNSAGLLGNVTYEIYRIGSFVNVSIMNEDASALLLSHSWSDGLDTKAYAFSVTMRTNFAATKMHAIFSNLYANFTYVESIPDSDYDGLTDDEEIILGTNPNNPDTDSDLLIDGDEVNIYYTDPLKDDTDNDLLEDGKEIKGIYSPFNPGANATGYVHTNATNSDTDFDTFIDSLEIILNSDPNNALSIPIITPPPSTIIENLTVTTTIEAGIVFGISLATIGLVLTIVVIVSRRLRKK